LPSSQSVAMEARPRTGVPMPYQRSHLHECRSAVMRPARRGAVGRRLARPDTLRGGHNERRAHACVPLVLGTLRGAVGRRVSDDPRSREPQSPLVPMNNSEVVSFDVLRGLDGISGTRRWLIVGAVAATLVAIGLFTFAATAGSGAGVDLRGRTPAQALAYLCA